MAPAGEDALDEVGLLRKPIGLVVPALRPLLDWAAPVGHRLLVALIEPRARVVEEIAVTGDEVVVGFRRIIPI